MRLVNIYGGDEGGGGGGVAWREADTNGKLLIHNLFRPD